MMQPARRPLILTIVFGLLLGWGGCGSEKQHTAPPADAVGEAMRQVATSRWGALLDETRSLRPAADGWELADRKDPIHSGYAPVRADAPVIISSDSKAPSAASGGPVAPVHHGRIEIHLRDRSSVEGVVAGNALVYPEAAQGADLVVTLRQSGVEELLVLRDDSAAHTLRYRLVLEPGMTAGDAAGGLTIFDALGRHFMRMTPPAAADATGAPVPVTLEWHQDGDTVELSLTVASVETYPVVVDPAWLYGAGFPEETIVGYQSVICEGCQIFGNVAVIDGSAEVYSGAYGSPQGWIHGDITADHVHLQTYAGQDPVVISGDVTFNELTSLGEVTINGTDIQPLDPVPLEVSVPVAPSFVTGGQILEITSYTALTPDSYASLTVTGSGAVAVLADGAYSFESIDISESGMLRCSGLCEIRVAGNVVIDNGYIGEGVQAERMTLFCLGDFDVTEGHVFGRIVVPNGTFRAEGAAAYDGRFIANDFEAVAPSTGALSFNGDSAPLAPDCQSYCDGGVALCGYAPAEVSSCVADCEGWLIDPLCNTRARWFVDCVTSSAGSDYCADDIPMREYCENEWDSLIECQDACSELNDGNDCTDAFCDCPPGACNGVVHLPSAQGTSCAVDSNPCTLPGIAECNGYGACVELMPAQEGTDCRDADVCNGDETCDGNGSCQPGIPLTVVDGTCTVATCDPVIGVIQTPTPGAACDDGNPCTGDGSCSGTTCEPGVPLDVDDGEVCTTDSCDPATGVISHTPAPGSPCPDANECDGEEICGSGGTCLAESGFPPNLDDENPCTADSCDILLGIQHVPLAGDGSNSCVVASCDLGTGTVYESTCSPIDATVPTQIGASTSFLYTGTDPVQLADVGEPALATVIDPMRVGVLRGRVLDDLGNPLAGVEVRVLALDPTEPSFGYTLTQTNGNFDMAVNGGGQQTLVFRRDGLISIQRTVRVPWLDFVNIGDVVMIPYDEGTTVNLDPFDPPTTFQVHQATLVTDGDGDRTATLLFKPGTTATRVGPGGTEALDEPTIIRATEFTVGDNGPRRMPGTLPPESAYTYAVELSADGTADDERVEFSQPVIFYLENFLDLDDVGGPVPVGYYDRTEGRWIGAPNGRIIEIINVVAGVAQVDLDGVPGADNANQTLLDELGIDQAELEQLGALYGMAVNKTMWRVPIPHFTPWDCNWPFKFPDNLPGPDGPNPPDPPKPDPKPNRPCRDPNGSSIECQSQVLHEEIDLVGTPFQLHHVSDRVPGREAAFELEIPLRNAVVPCLNKAPLQALELEVKIAGQIHQETFECNPDPTCQVALSCPETAQFLWDGLDAYGRTVQGEQSILVRIGWSYEGVYAAPGSAFGASFARFGGVPISGSRSRQRVTVWREWQGALGIFDSSALGFGGWTLSQQHAFSPSTGTLFLGDGRRRRRDFEEPVVSTVGGGGDVCVGEGSLGTDALMTPRSLAVSPDGTKFFTEFYTFGCSGTGSRVRKLTPAGVITTVAGTGSPGYNGDSRPALGAQLNEPTDVEMGPDGSVYIADKKNWRVRRISPLGEITTVAGTGLQGLVGDGGPAVAAELFFINAIAVAPDGSLYIAQEGNNVVRRVTPDGVIDRVAGGGAQAASSVPQRATEVNLGGIPRGIAVDGGGNFYVSAGVHVLRVTTDGMLTVFAGTGSSTGPENNGSPATEQAMLPYQVATDGSGRLYVVDGIVVRRIGADGIIQRFLGRLGPCPGGDYCGEGGPARAAGSNTVGIAIGPRGDLFATTSIWGRISRVTSPFPGVGEESYSISSDDGTQVFVFDGGGRHLATRDAVLGHNIFEFGYTDGLLTSITDAHDNETTIARGVDGEITITGPFGQETTYGVDPLDQDVHIWTNPNSETWKTTVDEGGLIQKFTNPRGKSSSYTYDTKGRITEVIHDGESDPRTWTRTVDEAGHTVVERETPLGRITEFHSTYAEAAGGTRTNTFASGLSATAVDAGDGSETVTLPNGNTITTVRTPDPRFGMLAPLTKTTTKTPANLTRTVEASRSVTLSDPDDILSVTGITETTKVNGIAFTREFDAVTRTWATTSPSGRERTLTLDMYGQAVEVAVPGFTTTVFAYDAAGRVASVTRGSRVTTFTYDQPDDGWLDAITDPMLQVTSFEVYDAVGRVLQVKGPDGVTINQRYDPNGNLAGVTPPGRPEHTFIYNGVDLPTEYAPPNLGGFAPETAWSYNDDRQVQQIIRPDTVVVDYDYDAVGRLDTIDGPSGDDRTYSYDALTGKLNHIATPEVAVALGYDGHLPTSTTWSGAITGTVVRAYDDQFRATGDTVSGEAVSYGYGDLDGLLTQAGDLSLLFDEDVALLLGTTIGTLSDLIGYNTFAEPVSYTISDGSGAVYDMSLAYDDIGRITFKTETIGATTTGYEYRYDEGNRLEDVYVGSGDCSQVSCSLLESYAYDLNGNRLAVTDSMGTTSATYDAQDRLEVFGPATYAYGPNGELESKTEASGATTYDYDVFGNLREVLFPSGPTITYIVDGRNRRVGKRVDGNMTQGFLYRGRRVIAELGPDGTTVVARFVYATKRHVPDYMLKGADTYRFVTDQLGSVRLVVDASDGTIAQQIDYDPWGKPTLVVGTWDLQPFGFAGGLYDSDTGLVRFGVRDYDAETGRWTSKDPASFGGGDTSLYAYVLGDPVNYIDASGRNALPWIWGAGEAIGGALLGAGSAAVAATGIAALAVFAAVDQGLKLWDELDPEIYDGVDDGTGEDTTFDDGIDLPIEDDICADDGEICPLIEETLDLCIYQCRYETIRVRRYSHPVPGAMPPANDVCRRAIGAN